MKHRALGITVIIALAVIILTLTAGCSITDALRLRNLFPGYTTAETGTNTQNPTPRADQGTSHSGTNSGSADARFKRGSASEESFSAVEIYRDNINSVVGIRSESKSTNIFGQTTVNASSGTGIVLTGDGYILTNNHIIEDGTTFKVTLYNGATYDAVIIGAEKSNDVAVLKIDANDLQPAVFGYTPEVVVGEDVIVVGNPLGELTFSLSRGVVSALNRAINEDGTPIIVFQIDAAVNEGNSGGPAFDSRGHVIGMVTAKVKSSQVEGIGFCIPVNDALNVASQLIDYGFVKGKGALGIAAATAYRQSFWGSTRVDGAYVNYVIAGSAAEKAGLAEGMLITEVDSTEITTPSELEVVIRGKPAGSTVVIKGQNSSGSFEVTVVLDEYTPDMIPAGWDYSNGTIM
ncbi:MAG: trypsin-like peptidase domain-containing protein [Clostridia bacterium]|nr:trypsin-like peptidase domain-containing protein [Clostridia bacterium]